MQPSRGRAGGRVGGRAGAFACGMGGARQRVGLPAYVCMCGSVVWRVTGFRVPETRFGAIGHGPFTSPPPLTRLYEVDVGESMLPDITSLCGPALKAAVAPCRAK